MKKLIILTVVFSLMFVVPGFAQRSSVDILRAGLLGAGSGAVGGLASGADGNDIWKGALTGAGVNIIGGVLLDMITEGSTAAQPAQRTVYVQQPRAYAQPQATYYPQTYQQAQPAYSQQSEYQSVYEQAYAAGYKAGYVDGYRDGVNDGI